MSHGKDIKARILNAGLLLWPNVSSRAIARHLNMSHSNVLYHFGNADALQLDIARHAVREGKSLIIVQLIAQNHAAIKDMGTEARQSHMALSRVLST